MNLTTTNWKEKKTMNKYEVTFLMNGRRTIEVVSARSSHDAKIIVEARYNGYKIIFLGSPQPIK